MVSKKKKTMYLQESINKELFKPFLKSGINHYISAIKNFYLHLANIEGTVIDFLASFVVLVEKNPFYHGILVPLFDIWRQIVIGKN